MHYTETTNKAQKAKELFLIGVSQSAIAKLLSADYITVWRWFRIAGVTDQDKITHKIKRLEINIESAEEWIDEHDCHKSFYGEDGCECDNVARS